jgi:hypothetical protein
MDAAWNPLGTGPPEAATSTGAAEPDGLGADADADGCAGPGAVTGGDAPQPAASAASSSPVQTETNDLFTETHLMRKDSDRGRAVTGPSSRQGT